MMFGPPAPRPSIRATTPRSLGKYSDGCDCKLPARNQRKSIGIAVPLPKRNPSHASPDDLRRDRDLAGGDGGPLGPGLRRDLLPPLGAMESSRRVHASVPEIRAGRGNRLLPGGGAF